MSGIRWTRSRISVFQRAQGRAASRWQNEAHEGSVEGARRVMDQGRSNRIRATDEVDILAFATPLHEAGMTGLSV